MKDEVNLWLLRKGIWLTKTEMGPYTTLDPSGSIAALNSIKRSHSASGSGSRSSIEH